MVCIIIISFRSHDRVLEAVTVNGEMCNINRFDPVLSALKMTKNPVFQLACMQFINAIVNTPEDMDFRVHLRNEFMRGGLGDALAVSYMQWCVYSQSCRTLYNKSSECLVN